MKRNVLLLLMIATITSCNQTIDEKMEALRKQEKSFYEKLSTVKNDSLKRKIGDFGQTIYQMKNLELSNLDVPKEAAYVSNPLVVLKDYPTSAELTNNYLDAIIANKTDTSVYGALLKLVTPFEFPFQVENKWSSVQFSNNTSALLTREGEPQPPDENIMALTLENGLSTDISVSYSNIDKKRQPAYIIGESTILLPERILEFKFSKGETGQTKEQHGIKVKLIDIKDHIVKIEIIDPLKTDARLDLHKTVRYKIMAKDLTTQFLADKENTNGPEESLKAYLGFIDGFITNPKSLNNLDHKLDSVEKKLNEKYRNTYFQTTYFKGLVEEVTVYVFDYSKAISLTKSLKIPVSNFEGTFKRTAIAEIPTSATVYDHEAAGLLNYKAELNEAELNTQLKIISVPLLKSASSNFEVPAKISFRYPQVLSAIFLADTNRFDGFRSVRFFDKKGGKQLNIPKDATNLENGKPYQDQPWDETSNSDIIYDPRKFPSAANFASGIVRIKLAKIEKYIYRMNNLPKGIKVIGNKIITDINLFKAPNNRYFVKDKTGKYLKQITTATYKLTDQQKNSVRYYYGVPYELERLENLGIRTVDLPFEVELNPE